MNDLHPTDNAQAVLPQGTRIGESYVVVRLLGEGGSGQVYLCRDEWLDRHVAIKLFHRGSDVSAFEAELDALVALNHPNLLSVFDRGLHRDSRNYIVTAFIAGPSLRDLLVSDGAFGYAETHRLLRDLASGLEALHQRGIVHGDLKPENVLLRPLHDAHYAPVIIDLGFSGERDSRPERLAASPAYVAPERLVGGAMGPACDIYALALIAFEMITGGAPMARNDLAATVHAHLSAQRPTLPHRGAESAWPDGLESALQAGMALDPNRRPRSATALVESIHRALEPHLVDVVSARCPSCARANIDAGDYCSDCGVQALPTRCPSCGNGTDPCSSTRCLHCDRSLFSQRPPRRLTKQRRTARLGTRAILVALGDALERVEARFALESEIRRAGGQLLGQIGTQFVAVFERTRGVPTAAQQAMRVASVVHQRVLQSLELPGGALTMSIECGSEESGGIGVSHGKLQLDQQAAQEAIRLAWSAHLRGVGGVWVGTRATRLLPPGSMTERVGGDVRLQSLGSATLRLPTRTADQVARVREEQGTKGAAAVILASVNLESRRGAVGEFARLWVEQSDVAQLTVPGRGHQYRPLGLVKNLIRNALVDLPEHSDRVRRLAEVLTRAGDSRERARSDAHIVLRSLDDASDEAEPGLVEGGLSAILWRALDGLLPERLILAVEEASALSTHEASQLVRIVDRRGQGSCLVVGCQLPLPDSPLHDRFVIIDTEVELEDGGYAVLTSALPGLARIHGLADVLPRLTGGRASAVREFFTLATHLETQATDPARLSEIVHELATHPDTLRAAHLALLNADEARCLRAIAAVGQDAMYTVVAAMLSDIDVAGCFEVLSGLGFVEIDYSRYDGDEVAISVRDLGLEAWIRQEFHEEAAQTRRTVRQICQAGHAQLSIDLSCRFAVLVAEDGDTLEAVRLMHHAANVTRHDDPWLALKIFQQAASRLSASDARHSLLGRSLALEVSFAEVQVAALYADPEPVLARCDELQQQSLDVVEQALIDRARALALRRLGWSTEAIPVLERAIRVLAQHEHEESVFADLCETLAELHFEHGAFDDARRVVRLYFAATGAGPFVAGPQARVTSTGGTGATSVYDANTDTFGVVEQADERHVQRANLRMRLLLAQASLRLGQLAQAERELQAVRAQLPALAGTPVEADVDRAVASFEQANGRREEAIEAARRAARGYWRLGRDDDAAATLLWLLESLDSGEQQRQQFLTCLTELRPERPDIRRRVRAQVRPSRGPGRWIAITDPHLERSSRPSRTTLPTARAKS